jgi:hypothetical protein
MWLFTIFYGTVFSIGSENSNSDINRYVEEIDFLHLMSYDFNGILQYFYLSGEFDVLRTFLAFIVSYFTGNGYYLIIVFGAIYGYFYSRNMWYVLNRLEGKTKSFTRNLIFCLFLVIPIWFMNGFRFWTAAHVFVFGLLPYLLEGKKKQLIWCFMTPFLFHYSFLILLIPLSIYLLLGNRIKSYFILFILTCFVSNIDIIQFNNLLSNFAPEILLERSVNYRGEEKVAEFRTSEFDDKRVWYARYYTKILSYVLWFFIISIYLFFKRKFIKYDVNKHLIRLLGFVFLFFCFANLMSTFPSGGRFMHLANLLAIVFVLLIMQNYTIDKKFKMRLYLATPFLLFFIIISIRVSWYSLSLMTLIGNPITSIITFGENISINDLIK